MLSGTLRKMRTELGSDRDPEEASYYLRVGDQELPP